MLCIRCKFVDGDFFDHCLLLLSDLELLRQIKLLLVDFPVELNLDTDQLFLVLASGELCLLKLSVQRHVLLIHLLVACLSITKPVFELIVLTDRLRQVSYRLLLLCLECLNLVGRV